MNRIGFIQPRLIGFGGVEMYGMHVAQALSRKYPLDIITAHEVDRKQLEKAFDLDLSGANFLLDPRCTVRLDLPRFERWRAQRALADLVKPYPLTILNNFELPDVCFSRRGILLNHSAVTNSLKLHERKGLPLLLARLSSRGRTQLDVNRRVRSWTQVVTNSQFTRRSFQRLWHRDSKVIYPPIRVADSIPTKPSGVKIVGCGFFSGLPDSNEGFVCGIKRQDLLIEAFRLLSRQIQGAELILTGHYVDSDLNSRALNSLRTQAKDLSVRFLLNVPHEQLTHLFRESHLFWQATGYGRDPLEQVGMVETFGMAMVESMGCGCVPFAFDAGGAGEVIANVDPALLWNSVEELASKSTKVLQTDDRFSELSRKAHERARDFSPTNFETAWLRQVEEVWR